MVKDLSNKTVASVSHLAIYCPEFNRSILSNVILCYAGPSGKTIVFTQTKADANDLYLSDKLKGVEVLHGDIPQQQREVTYKGFKEGRFNILVATDVASRGLDIPNVDLIVQCEPPKDVESYIHRAGRTARAGKSGTVVTFYNKKQAYMMQKIEETAGVAFTKVDTPQEGDIIKASNKSVFDSLRRIPIDDLGKYKDTADAVIKEFGEKNALLLAIACISGDAGKTKEKSLLNGAEGMITFIFEADSELRSSGYAWNIIRRLLPTIDTSQIKQLVPCLNSRGAIFDVPESAASRLEAAYNQEQSKGRHLGYTVKRVTELPEGVSGKVSNEENAANNKDRSTHTENCNPEIINAWSSCTTDPRLSMPPVEEESKSHVCKAIRSNHISEVAAHIRSRSNSPEHHHHSHSSEHHSSHHEHREHHEDKSKSRTHENGNDVFMWGLKTEDDIKDFLMEHKLAWQRIKILKGNIVVAVDVIVIIERR